MHPKGHGREDVPPIPFPLQNNLHQRVLGNTHVGGRAREGYHLSPQKLQEAETGVGVFHALFGYGLHPLERATGIHGARGAQQALLSRLHMQL